MSLDLVERQISKHPETYGRFMSEVMGTRDNGNLPLRDCSKSATEKLFLPGFEIFEDVNSRNNSLKAQSEQCNVDALRMLQNRFEPLSA